MTRAAHGFAACALLLGLACAGTARAQDQFFDTDGETIGTVNGSAYLGTVNVAPFTVFTDAATQVSLDIYVNEQATLAMQGGTVEGYIYAFNDAVVTISSGTVNGLVEVSDDAELNIEGGEVGLANFLGFDLFVNARANVTGGEVYAVNAYGASSASFEDAAIRDSLNFFDTASGFFGGGVVVDRNVAFRLLSGTAGANVIAGGTFLGMVDTVDAARLEIRGGLFNGAVSAFGTGSVAIRGGSFIDMSLPSSLLAAEDSVIRLFGSDLRITDTVDLGGGEQQLTLAGTLEDGSSVDGLLAYTSSNGRIELNAVPGPAALPLFALGFSGVGLALRRRTRK